MVYKIKVYSQVVKFIKKHDILNRFKEKFKEVKKNPFHFLEYMKKYGCYKLRIGDYRLLIDVDKEKRILWVRYIEHRKKIYKRIK